jgi:hypothetical protein
LQLKKLKSPYTAEQAAVALTRFAKETIGSNAERKKRMHEYFANFSLAHVVPESMRNNDGWRDEWDDHVLFVSLECVEAVEAAADTTWTAEKAIRDVQAGIDLDF